MANHAELKAADILRELRECGEVRLQSTWRRDQTLVAAVRLLARQRLVVSCRQGGATVLFESDHVHPQSFGALAVLNKKSGIILHLLPSMMAFGLVTTHFKY